jgi:hypothetical protein
MIAARSSPGRTTGMPGSASSSVRDAAVMKSAVLAKPPPHHVAIALRGS